MPAGTWVKQIIVHASDRVIVHVSNIFNVTGKYLHYSNE